jgi:hypothetical protein
MKQQIEIQLFPIPKQPITFCQEGCQEEDEINKDYPNKGNQSMFCQEGEIKLELVDSIQPSLGKDSLKVNSKELDISAYILIDDIKNLLFSKCLSGEELRFVLHLAVEDTLCTGIPINWFEFSRRLDKSRTTLLSMKQSLVERNIVEEINQGKGKINLYRLLPLDGWQEKYCRPKKVSPSKSVNDVNSNVIDFPNVKEEVTLETTTTIWRNPEDSDSDRYWTTGPIYDDVSGIEVTRQCEEEGLIPQQVVKRAIAFSKVPQLILGTIASIADKLINFIDKLGEEAEKQQSKPASSKKVIPPVQKLNTPKGSGGRYDSPYAQKNQNALEKWYREKKAEGWFRDDWEDFLKNSWDKDKMTNWQVNRRGDGIAAVGCSARQLYKEWDETLINWEWGYRVYSREATFEQYLEWLNGNQAG